jgi:WD40 repeat protein
MIASVSNDDTVKLWNLYKGVERHTFARPSSEWFSAVVFSLDSELLALATGSTIKLWDTYTGAERHMLGHKGRVRAIVFSLDSKFVALASNDKIVKLWDAGTGAKQHTCRIPRSGQSSCHLARWQAGSFSIR